MGNKWSEIARAFAGRSENSVKNRWNSKQRRSQAAERKRVTGSELGVFVRPRPGRPATSAPGRGSPGSGGGGASPRGGGGSCAGRGGFDDEDFVCSSIKIDFDKALQAATSPTVASVLAEGRRAAASGRVFDPTGAQAAADAIGAQAAAEALLAGRTSEAHLDAALSLTMARHVHSPSPTGAPSFEAGFHGPASLFTDSPGVPIRSRACPGAPLGESGSKGGLLGVLSSPVPRFRVPVDDAAVAALLGIRHTSGVAPSVC